MKCTFLVRNVVNAKGKTILKYCISTENKRKVCHFIDVQGDAWYFDAYA